LECRPLVRRVRPCISQWAIDESAQLKLIHFEQLTLLKAHVEIKNCRGCFLDCGSGGKMAMLAKGVWGFQWVLFQASGS
jgi:hypothetical protein